MTRHHLGGHMAFMNGFVRQHGLSHQITNRKNMLNRGAHLTIDSDESTLIDLKPSSFSLQ